MSDKPTTISCSIHPTNQILSKLLSYLKWQEKSALKLINSTCIGYSGNSHWQFFRNFLKTQPSVRKICVLGVYYGRDIAYINHFLKQLGRENYSIIGIDKFENNYCEDWPVNLRGLTWEEAGFGLPPSLAAAENNLITLGLSDNVFLYSEKDDEFLKNSEENFDFIYIDTSHDYETVKKLISLAAKKVTNDGFLGGDDFSDQGTWGVKRAVKESFSQIQVFDKWIWLARREDFLSL